MSSNCHCPPKGKPKNKKKMEKKIEKKVEKKIEEKIERAIVPNPRARIKQSARLAQAERTKIQTVVLGRLQNINYEAIESKFGKKGNGKQLIEKNAAVTQNMGKQFALAQAMPAIYQSKIPDGFKKKTAFYHSRKVFEITVGEANNLDFAFLVQPKIGNFGDPFEFQVAKVKQDALLNPQDYDFEDVDAYDLGGVSDSTSLAVDSNFTALVGKGTGSAKITTTSGWTPDKPYTASPTITDWNLILIDASATNSAFIFPPGNYFVLLHVGGTALTVASGSVYNITMPNGGTWENETSEVLTGTSPNATASMKGIIVQATDTGNLLQISCNAGLIGFAQMFVYPMQEEGMSTPINEGFVSSIRPTAMSVLTTYTGPTLTDGGNIASALIPGAAILSNYLTNNPTDPGSFRNWQAIATLTEAEHDGRLSKGAYTTWTQEENVDFDFFTPEQLNNWQYNAIVVAGTFNNGGTVLSADTVIARVEVDIQFEIRTTKNLLPKDYYVGSQGCIDAANQMAQNIPFSQENETHMETFKRYFGYVLKAYEVAGAVASMFA